MQGVRVRRVRRGDGKQLGMFSPSDNEEEDERDIHLVATVLAGMPGAKEVQDMLGHTDPTGTAGDHENQAGIIPGSQGEKETELHVSFVTPRRCDAPQGAAEGCF